MKNLYLSELIHVIDGTILSKTENDPLIKNVVSGRRGNIKNFTLIFFPIKSRLKNQDLQSCVIVTRKPELFMDLSEYFTIIKVKSSNKAYNKFLEFYRNLFPIPVVGITGTCGKTTTKEMVATILKADRKIVQTIASRNDPYRNLRYLMKVNEQTEAVVIEAGIGSPGGIEKFNRHFQPKIGVITNIGTDHGSGFQTQQDYIKEKEMMVKIINQNKGTIILNIDDQHVKNFDVKNFNGRVIYFGLSEEAHFKASNIHYDEQGMKFSVHYGNQVFECKINCFGRHNVYNALAALAVTTSLGIEIKESIKRLESFRSLERHLQIRKGMNDCLLIDDTWNTNSKSIEAALETVVTLSKGRKIITVLGDIEELGDIADSEHEKIGVMIHKYKIDQLVTIGEKSKLIAQKAKELGMNQRDIFILNNPNDLVNILTKIVDRNSVVLIKTSMRHSFSEVLQKLIIV